MQPNGTPARTGIRVKVAGGIGPTGGPWSLWWPSWKWERMTPAEKRAAIDNQAALLGAAVTWRIDSE